MQSVARDRFDCIANETLTPLFMEFADFTGQYIVQASIPVERLGIRTFRFALAEDVYLLITFRHAGFEQCETQAEFFVPDGNPLSPTRETVSLSDANNEWCRSIFENALDLFLDKLINAMDGESDSVARRAAVPAVAR